MSDDEEKLLYAFLLLKTPITPATLATLTEYQINELYGHARTREGGLKLPVPLIPKSPQRAAPTFESSLAQVQALYRGGLIKKANFEAALAKLKAKYGK